MIASLILAALAVVGLGALTREWNAPFTARFFQTPAFWPWSRRSWLGVKSGDLVGPFWLFAAAGVISLGGRGGDVSAVVMVGTTALLVCLFLFGVPSILMPGALRGTFRGVLRRLNAPENTERPT